MFALWMFYSFIPLNPHIQTITPSLGSGQTQSIQANAWGAVTKQNRMIVADIHFFNLFILNIPCLKKGK